VDEKSNISYSFEKVLDAVRLYWDANWDWWIRMLPGNLFLIAFPSWNLAHRAWSQEFMQHSFGSNFK
jgi:hypothetical protein